LLLWAPMRRPDDLAAIRSLAVLPFKRVGAQDGNEYLRLGLTDALITKISNLKRIVVRPTNAVRKYDALDAMAAGRELGVDAVVDGNVQQIDQQIRVTVQLISVKDGSVLWGGKFDEKFTNLFAVQDAISEQVARALEPGLSGEEKNLLAKRYTTNAEAHHAYALGRFYWNRRTGNDLKEAIKHFSEAVEKDPNYALAYVGLADSYSLLADYSAAKPSESYGKARDAALKALALDDSLAEAHTSLAYVKMYYYWDWAGAETAYRRAIDLNPNYATAHQWYSEYLTAMGRFDEALAEIRRAREIDPLSPVINAGEVWILYFARRYDEAIEQGRKVQEMSPEFAEVHEYLKRVYDQKGLYRDAIAARQMRRKLAGFDANETPAIKAAAAAANADEYWQRRLQQELEDARHESPATFDLAEIYSRLGDKEQSFQWLERAFEERHYAMMYLKVAPNLDPLRSDPRFADILRRVGLGT
jgi:TolB-like protein/Tfp pilus assembly protein PilF